MQTRDWTQNLELREKWSRQNIFILDFYGEQMQSNVTAERAEWWRVEDRFNNHKQGSVAYPSKSRSAAAL